MNDRFAEAATGEPVRYHHAEGDVWASCWAPDDSLYVVVDDGGTWGGREVEGYVETNLSLVRLEGEPDAFEGATVNAMREYGVMGELKTGPDDDGASWKATGCACIDGVLYVGVSRHAYGTEDTGFRQRTTDASIIASHDFGATWRPTAQECYAAPMFPGPRFANPSFVDYGRDGRVPEGVVAPDGAGEWVYVVSNDSFWNNGDVMRLARVPRSKVADLDPADWEFYRGSDGDLDGLLLDSWTRSLDEAGTILSGAGRMSMTGATYVPGLGRYVMVQWHYPNLARQSKYTVTVWEWYTAPSVWGPWELETTSRWSPDGFYNPSIPSKHVDETGRRMTVLTSGDFSYGAFSPTLGADEVAAAPYCLTTIPVELLARREVDSVAPEPAGPIVNPGFEEGSLGWTAANVLEGKRDAGGVVDTNNHTLAAVNVHSGRCAGRLVLEGSRLSQRIDGLRPDTAYALTLFAKVRSAEQDALLAGVEGFDGAGAAAHATVRSTNWEPVRVEFTTGPASESATIVLLKTAGRGEAWFDDFALEEH